MLHPKTKPASFGRRIALLGVGFILTIFVVIALGGITVAVAYNSIASNLKPRLEEIADHQSFQSSRIYDRHGTLLYEFVGSGRREPVTLADVSTHLISATIAVEDATFYENSGVNYFSIARAAWANITNQDVGVGGASTISQQVIKLIVLTPEERDIENVYNRKFKEIVLAQELDSIYSKDQILELYLNEIPYGNLAYGIQAASQTYFNVDAKDLSLAQASLLAGLPQRPSSLNPFQYVDGNLVLPGLRLKKDTWLDAENYDYSDIPNSDQISLTKIRQVDVLRQMVKSNFISERQAREVAAEDLQFKPQEVSLLAPHFVFYVQEYLERRYGSQVVAEGGLEITTTLDLSMQNMAQTEAYSRILELENDGRNIHNAAVVMMQPNTGQILAMVGSIGYNLTRPTDDPTQEGNVLDGKVNVTTRQRQPGSALKPFTYMSGMEQYLRTGGERGLTPGTVIWDVPTIFNPGGVSYEPENYDRRAHGPLRPRTAVANSLNIPAVKALKAAGIPETLDLLHRMGVAPDSLANDPGYYGLALTLGGGEVTPLDLATAYNTLASGGRYFAPTPILKITNAKGEVVEEFQPTPADPSADVTDVSRCVVPTIESYELGVRVPNGTQCVDGRLAYIITTMISDNEARRPIFGLNSVLHLSQPAAVKTGTTNEFRDAWASGFTPFLTVTVWTGNNNNESTGDVESTVGGGTIWNRVMERVFANERMMQTLAEPYGGLENMPQAFPRSYAGVFDAPVCNIPGSFGGRDTELFVEGLYKKGSCDLYEKIDVVRISTTSAEGQTQVTYCRPVEGTPPGDIVSVYVWKLPKSDEDEKIDLSKWSGFTTVAEGEDKERVAALDVQSLPACSPEMFATPTPEQPPTPTPLPAGKILMPALQQYGENQAKEILYSLGIRPEQIVVDYQGRDRLGAVFDQYPAYAVVSTQPAAGSVIDVSTTIVLGIRAPDSAPPPTSPPQQPTAVPQPQPTAVPPQPTAVPQPQPTQAPPPPPTDAPPPPVTIAPITP